jgi:hypothetical protein
MPFRSKRLFGPLLSGLAFALLTWLIIGDHGLPNWTGRGSEWLGYPVMILLFPGFIAAFAVSNSIHIADTWVVASGNFVFYFGLTYLVGGFRAKRKAKARNGRETIETSSTPDQ